MSATPSDVPIRELKLSSFRLPIDLHKRLRLAAAQHDTTLTDIVVTALQDRLRELDDAYAARQADVRTFGGGERSWHR
jgi:predicted DNA-binding protein